MDLFTTVFIQYQDHLAPTLDVYEQAIYVFLLRQTHLEGKREAVIGFKSARKKLGFGIGKAGTAPSEGVVYEKLRSLEAKGCIALLGSERAGTRIEVKLPSEIPGVVQPRVAATPIDIETEDFFSVSANGAVNLPDIVLGSASQIPTSLAITPSNVSFTSLGQTTSSTGCASASWRWDD